MKYINEYSSYEKALFDKAGQEYMFIMDILDKLVMEGDDNDNRLVFFINRENSQKYMQYVKSTKGLYVSNDYIIREFLKRYPNKAEEMLSIIKILVEKKFNIKVDDIDNWFHH